MGWDSIAAVHGSTRFRGLSGAGLLSGRRRRAAGSRGRDNRAGAVAAGAHAIELVTGSQGVRRRGGRRRRLAHDRSWRVLLAARSVRVGKTTVLRMIAGFEHPSAGAILLGGRTSPARRPTTATSTPCSRTTRCSPTCPCARTSSTGSGQGCGAVERRRRATESARDRPPRAVRRSPAEPVQWRAAPAARARPGLVNRPGCCCSTNHSVRSTSSSTKRCRSS